MSASNFISELERRSFISERKLTKLREYLNSIDAPMSAEKLAEFLVEKGHLTQQQASDVLAGLTMSGVNLTMEDIDQQDYGADSSSVFGSSITRGPINMPPPEDDDDEIRLAPLEDEFADDKDEPIPSIETFDDEPIRIREEPAIESAHGWSSQELPPVRLAELEDVSLPGAPPDAQGESELAKAARTEKIRARRATGLTRDGKKKVKPTKSAKRWDSPIILIGGGVLAFMLLAGGAIAFLLNYQSGDQKLALAREAMKSGAYPQAIEHFQAFIASSSRHPEHSNARVELAMVKIRQPTDGGDFQQALAIAETEAKAVEDEPAFDDSHAELAALLPQIAQGLAKQAEQAAPTTDESKKLVEDANKALELCNNAKYLPKSLRDEAKLAIIHDTLDRVERRQKSQFALADGLKAMDDAVAAGKPMGAYEAHLKLLQDHPELADEKELAEAIKKTSAAELAAIKFVAEKQAAETKDRPTPWVAALAVANHRGGTAPATGIACVRIDGAVYALDAANGRLLWRRYVGFGGAGWPGLVDRDVIFADTVRHELLRLDAATGKLLWRQEFKEPFSQPLVVGDRAYVPSDSGKLYVLDLKSGERTGYMQFAQRLRAAPTIDRQKATLYLIGERASLYSISLADMKCAGVYFLGHAPGTIQVAPVAVMDKLAVAENNGAETSRLHLLSLGDKGVVAKEASNRRLKGLVTSPPLTTGRGLVVITDRGLIEVYDIAAGKEGDALVLVATREATGSQPLMRHAAVIGRNIWLADTQLSKFNIVPTGNRLPVEELQQNYAGSTFDHPIAAFGETLIEVHRPKGRAGAVVAALDTKQGRPLWETDLAMPPAGAPVVDEANKSLVAATAAGYVFRFDEAAFRARVQDQPLAAEHTPSQPPALTQSIDLGQGRAVFSTVGADKLLHFNPGSGGKAQWVHLESPLACNLSLFGQGFLAPSKIGQVFYLSSADVARLATPFQPRIEPGVALDYKPAGAVSGGTPQFVITDGAQKLFLVGLVDQPQPHLEAAKSAEVSPQSITSPVIVLGDTALAVAGDSRLVRYRLPALELAGESALPAPIEWGPYAAADVALLATVDQKLVAAKPSGETQWQAPLENGQLAGPPLVLADSVLLAYRKGVVERRSLQDGKVIATLNVEHPLATGPVAFLQKLVVTAADGTILIVEQP